MEATVPAAHRVVVEPDQLVSNSDVPLLPIGFKQSANRVVIVIAPDEVNVFAADSLGPIGFKAGGIEPANGDTVDELTRQVQRLRDV